MEKDRRPFMERKINMDRLAELRTLEGDVYRNVKVIDIGKEGDGVARLHTGVITIIKDKTLKVGQVLDIEVTKVTNKCCFAKVVGK